MSMGDCTVGGQTPVPGQRLRVQELLQICLPFKNYRILPRFNSKFIKDTRTLKDMCKIHKVLLENFMIFCVKNVKEGRNFKLKWPQDRVYVGSSRYRPTYDQLRMPVVFGLSETIPG